MDLSDELIQEAFALSEKRGVALLSLLSNYSVWHGDLAEMRGDSPRLSRQQQSAPTSPRFADVVLMSRALALLDSKCRAALSVPDGGGDRKRRTECKERLTELYAQLQQRENGAVIHSHRE